MNPKNDRRQPEPARPAPPTPAPKKRFRIEKLEERIAPRKDKNLTDANCAWASSISGSGGVF